MIASPALHLLAALAIATSPPADPSTCAADDLQCSAPAFAAAARRATSDAQRVQYLYFAHRAYLALSDKPPKGRVASRDLCQAHRLLEQALALPETPLRGRIVDSERETLARLTTKKVQCKAPKPGNKDRPIVAAAAPPGELRSDAATDEPSTIPAGIAAEPQTDDAVAAPRLADLDGWPPTTVQPEPDTDLMPVAARHLQTERPASSPRPGRRLVIAGGVTLGVGVALTTAAGLMSRRMVDTRREIVALGNGVDGYATTDQNTQDDALRGDYRATQTRTLALALAGGATVLVAVILTSIGGRRMARAASRTALVPAPGGLVFHARF
ncbi:MAG: hypothetical protein IPG88_27360 [Gemmatimonadetes bacterium]|nr:hypothetical protein [Gemmatimonadota bacterium]